ncbi:MAP kinase kinase (MEK), partial [Cladochytrium tenue]
MAPCAAGDTTTTITAAATIPSVASSPATTTAGLSSSPSTPAPPTPRPLRGRRAPGLRIDAPAAGFSPSAAAAAELLSILPSRTASSAVVATAAAGAAVVPTLSGVSSSSSAPAPAVGVAAKGLASSAVDAAAKVAAVPSVPAGTEIEAADVEVLSELGVGNGGTVNLCMHKPTGTIMARKIIHVEANRRVQRQIVRELLILRTCASPYIVTFYGAFASGAADVSIAM